ncbi:hypothetical protein HHK36_023400 [Tetracentron sinense]|uniref:DNA-directed RNA polymerase n=1 Tax=Tetracentron sinense TaxID=13715 RepID=A0A834YN62_TETSI|nr:hypothetical protein HHK36_023400 [Tetracentron sinense]
MIQSFVSALMVKGCCRFEKMGFEEDELIEKNRMALSPLHSCGFGMNGFEKNKMKKSLALAFTQGFEKPYRLFRGVFQLVVRAISLPMEDSVMSSDSEPLSKGLDMDLDENGEVDSTEIPDFSEEYLTKFCREASVAFFNEFGLISHQINSYNDFVKNGIQKLFDSMAEITVEPGFDPSKKGDGEWRYASVRFGKVTLERPRFWTGEKADSDKEYLNLMPRHARLQNMTYSSRLKLEIEVEVFTQMLMKSDKFKTGKEKYLHKEVISTDKRDVVIGRIPVMVKSDLCWMNDLDKGDCDFDHGGYFLIKGAEKVSF